MNTQISTIQLSGKSEFPFKTNKAYEDVHSTNFTSISHGWRIKFSTSTRSDRIVRTYINTEHRSSTFEGTPGAKPKENVSMTSCDETDETRSDAKSLALFSEIRRLSVARETTVVTGFVKPATHGATFIVGAELVIPYATQTRTYFMVHNERSDCNGGEDAAVIRRTKWRRDQNLMGRRVYEMLDAAIRSIAIVLRKRRLINRWANRGIMAPNRRKRTARSSVKKEVASSVGGTGH